MNLGFRCILYDCEFLKKIFDILKLHKEDLNGISGVGLSWAVAFKINFTLRHCRELAFDCGK